MSECWNEWTREQAAGLTQADLVGPSMTLSDTPGAWWLKGDISWAFFRAYFRRIFGFLRYGRSYACFLRRPPYLAALAPRYPGEDTPCSLLRAGTD